MAELVDIPEPPGWPFVGNITALNPDFPLGSMTALADQYGEIYRLRFPGRSIVLVSTHALVHETCDEKRFKKSVNAALKEVRHGIHDGLFTATGPEEENWGIAHRILMPAFGPLSIRKMYDEMHDIASQLALKWARYGSDTPIMVTDDFTRLTLDTLALCSMGYRFNSYYSPIMHPFIEAMGDFLLEAGQRGRRLPLPAFMYQAVDKKFEDDIKVLRDTARGVLDARRAGNDDRYDLLSAMLKGRDSKTGKKMTDESIMDNLITFLIAGHETTSGLLSFAFEQLLRHPEAYQKAQREVDEVVGKGPITVDHLSKLPYINGVLREVLRVNAPIPAFTVLPFEDEIIGGKYKIEKGETVINLLAKSQLDPLVFGDDATEFKPERMMDEPFDKLMKEFPNSWKPFGNGMRGCIGRPFAWQEALLVMAMLLQNFNFVMEPGFSGAIKQTLTIKPKDMYMRAILRDGLTPTTLEKRLAGRDGADKAEAKAASNGADDGKHAAGVPLTILYGSNSGTCEALAQRIATDAPSHGFRAAKVDCLDSAKGQLPKNQPVVIVTASYEGQPPDNAGHFVAWIQDSAENSLKDTSYTVFGCGHKDWAATYHKIPKFVDSQLEKLGASRVAEIGLADASGGNLFTEFETWEDNVLWPSLSKKFDVSSADAEELKKTQTGVKVSLSTPRYSTLRQEVKEAVVVETHTLTAKNGTKAVKKHLEIKLPEDMTYAAGDYLAVLPMNPRESVHRALRRFKLPRDAHLEINVAGGASTLPSSSSISATDILGSYVELSQPATKRNINSLVEYTTEESTKTELKKLANESFDAEVTAKRLSVLDILERFPDVDLPIGIFLSLMPPMRVRQYSISSSPIWNPHHVTVTFSVLNEPALSGQGSYIGVATSYLDSLYANDIIHVAVRPSHAAFSMPTKPESTPAIYIAAGSGLAPFRGFIQERATMLSHNSTRKLAPAVLFFGCHSPDQDDLYREELDEWEKLGAVKVYRAYSRAPEKSNGLKHVDDAMWEHRDELLQLWKQEAKVYVCGSRGVAQSVQSAVIKIRAEWEKNNEVDADTEDWFENLRNTRYVTDVFD
ncbi:unnamed protein product [Clonostachys rosea]|uniref:Bifunctional cytochrome P450/NADPH--P450 reductase n=1 Tax=Bionectria ochroleuca TaxID=29856 RepID=A0ABY6TS03_BIOOC|nr:unnamed protein product [Clonostachys rosea]